MEGNHHTDSHICNSLLYSFSGLFISMSLGKEQEIAHRTYVKHESEFGNEEEQPIYVLFSTKRICVDVLPASFQEQEGRGNILCLLDTRKTVEVIFLTTCLYTSYNTCFVHLSGHNATGRHITYNERRSIRHVFYQYQEQRLRTIEKRHFRPVKHHLRSQKTLLYSIVQEPRSAPLNRYRMLQSEYLTA